MRFGVELPTCTAGMMYPVPFAIADDVVRVAIEAEQLGYHDGNSAGAFRRAGELCDGRLPAKIGPIGVRRGRGKVAQYARAAGRDPAQIRTALQTVVCIGDTPAHARELFERSAFDLFRDSLAGTMMKDVEIDQYFADNLIGTPDEICARVAAFADAGLEEFVATLFVGNTVAEMLDQIRRFARDVIPAFS